MTAPLQRFSQGHTQFLLTLIGLTLPFPMLGVPLNDDFVLSTTTVLGLIHGLRSWQQAGWTRPRWAALWMLAAFVASAVTRHSVTTYALSIAALAVALMPLTAPATGTAQIKALLRGLSVGLVITLVCVLLSYLFQAAGSMGMPAPLVALFVRTPETGAFLGFIRPTAGFSEPSHLAMYLATYYVALDMLARTGHRSALLRPLIIFIVLISGSLSGVMLFVLYFLGRLISGARRLLAGGLSVKAWARTGLIGMVLLVTVGVQGPEAFDFMDDYVSRIVKTQEDIESLNLVGSEASRINAVLALPDYWETSGTPGFLFGTGYANYQEWLLDTYGHLGESATFARGQIDNVMIAVFLSTGLVGFVAFVRFIWMAFGTPALQGELALLLFVVGVNFSYGFLIAGLYWQLLFLLASVAQYCHSQRAQRSNQRFHAKPRRPVRPAPAKAQEQPLAKPPVLLRQHQPT